MAILSTIRTAFLPGDFAKGLAGFRNRTPSELQPCGVAALDAVLGGGFPRGSLVEVCGPVSSGRSSLAFALLTEATRRGEACAFIDVSDSLDPLSLAAAGVDVARLLWIRCGEAVKDNPSQTQALSNIAPSRKTKNNGSETLERPGQMQRGGFFWKHPRNQIHGIEASIPQLMRKKQSNKSEVAKWKEEQVEADRQLPRRGGNIRKHLLPPLLPGHLQHSVMPPGTERKPWRRLEQALKATDLLLHSGGWGVVVFDMGNVSWVDARRIPLSTWFRFQRTVENTPTILLLLVENSCAKSCASVVLRCQRLRANWDSAVFANAMKGPVTFRGFEVQGEIVRSRTHFQESSSASWETRTVWNGNL